MRNNVRRKTLATAIGLVAVGMLYVSDPTPTLTVLIVTAMLIGVASWEPAVAIGLTVGTLALYHHPFQTGSTTLAPSELLLAACVIGTLVQVVAGRAGFRASLADRRVELVSRLHLLTSRFGRISILSLAGLSVAGIAILSTVGDADARSAGLREVRWTLLEPLILVGLLLWHVRQERDRAFIVGMFAAGGLAVAAWGLIDAFSGGGVSAGGVTRAGGPFPHPNAFALFLLRPLVLGTAFLVMTRSRSVPAWLACSVGAAALVLSFSRSAALGLIVAFIVLWPWLSPRLRLLTVTASVAVAAGLVLVARDRAFGTSGQDSLALRGDIWQSGIEMIRDRPLLGYGPDQFLYTYTPRYISPVAWAERFTSHGHNLLIDAWVRIGIIGAACALLALALVAYSAGDVARAADRFSIEPLAGAAIVALVAAGAQAMVDNGYFVHDLAMSAWLLGWIAFAKPAHQRVRGAPSNEHRRDRRSRAGRVAPL